MKNGLLYTKLQPSPVAMDIVPRDRLLSQLEHGRNRLLTVILAPAGYGKSTLASSWAVICDAPCGWLSLDEDDSDLHQFLLYFLAAIQKIYPKACISTEALLESETLPPASELARYLLNDLEQISESFILILDDYHRITGTSVHEFLASLLTHPARSMHLVLLTRTHPRLPIAKLRGLGLVNEVTMSDLRFTKNEVTSFMNLMLDVHIDNATIDILEGKTEGWAVGLRLAGLYLKAGKDLKKRSRELGGNSRHIADYYFSEVLSRQHPEMMSYLLDSSIPDRFSKDLCTHMRAKQGQGQSDVSAEQFIHWLMENNLFVVPLDDEGYWFRYHHLFRDLLKDILIKQDSEERILGLNWDAGIWFSQNGLIEEAVRHLMAAKDHKTAAKLIRENRYELMNTSQFARLTRLLAALPENVIANDPYILTTKALLGTDVGKSIDIYAFTRKAAQKLEALSPKSGTYDELKGEVLVLKSLINMLIGDASSGLLNSQKALAYLPENAMMVKSLGVLALCVSHQMTGCTPKAVKTARQAVSDPFHPPNIRGRMQICLMFTHYLNANLPGVIAASEKCLEIIDGVRALHTRAYAYYFMGLAHYMRNHLDSAEHSLLKVLKDRYSINPAYVGDSGYMLVCIYLAQGKTDRASQMLELLGAHCRENTNTRAGEFFQAFEAEVALRQGNTRKVEKICRHAVFDAGMPRWFFYVPQFTLIKHLMLKGTSSQLQDALTQLAEWDEKMKKINRINIRIQVLVLLTIVHQMRHKEDAAMECLRTALDLAYPGGWVRSFIDAGPTMIAVLENFLKSTPDHQFAKDILEASYKETRQESTKAPGNDGKARPFQQSPVDFLTRRETELLPFLAEGLSNKEIAAILSISDGTVKTHLKHIFRKLKATNRVEAVNKARRIGIIGS